MAKKREKTKQENRKERQQRICVACKWEKRSCGNATVKESYSSNSNNNLLTTTMFHHNNYYNHKHKHYIQQQQQQTNKNNCILRCTNIQQQPLPFPLFLLPSLSLCLLCSTGRNQPPMYTETLPGESLALMITSLTSEMGGRYYCTASYANTEILTTTVTIKTYGK